MRLGTERVFYDLPLPAQLNCSGRVFAFQCMLSIVRVMRPERGLAVRELDTCTLRSGIHEPLHSRLPIPTGIADPTLLFSSLVFPQ